ncbi:MAG TPA: hypothetical protein V6D47_01430 [Oscillatoriaceae cyanobacterium]
MKVGSNGGAGKAGSTHKGPVTPEDRVHFQLKRIEDGVKNGNLTKAQADKLKSEVKAIGKEIKGDGKNLSADQKKALEQKLDGASGDIFEQKQTGRIQKLEKAGKLSTDEANKLTSEIQQSGSNIRQDGHNLKKDWKSLQSDLHKDEKSKSKLALPGHHPKVQ